MIVLGLSESRPNKSRQKKEAIHHGRPPNVNTNIKNI